MDAGESGFFGAPEEENLGGPFGKHSLTYMSTAIAGETEKNTRLARIDKDLLHPTPSADPRRQPVMRAAWWQ
jgi:hypothetical protein